MPLFFLFLICTSGGSLLYAFEQERIDDSGYDPSSTRDGVRDVLFAWVNMVTLT